MRLSREVLLLFGAALSFALMAPFTRASGEPALTVSAWRAVFVAFSFGIWAVSTGGVQSLLLPRAELLRAAVYGGAVALASSTYVGGFTFTTVANTVFFHALAPLFVIPLARWRFGERPTDAALVGIGIAVAGVGLLSGVSIFHLFRFTDTRFLLGDFLAFLSAVAYAAVLVATREARNNQVPIVPMLAVAWGVAALVLVGVAGVGGSLSLSLPAVPWVLALALVSTTLPFYLLNLGMAGVSAGLGSLIGMSEVVFATVIGVVLYGEWPAPIGLLGGALLVIGIVHPLLERTEDSEGPPPVSDTFRLLRLGLRLVLLNGGAVIGLLGSSASGQVLAWAALASTPGLGLGAAQAAAGPRYAGILSITSGLFAIGCLAGLLSTPLEGIHPGAALLAGAVYIADRWLGRREQAEDADTWTRTALLALAAAGLLSYADHPGFVVFDAAARVLIGGVALRTLLRAIGTGSTPFDRLPIGPRVLVALVLTVVLGGGLRTIPAGHVALVQRFGEPLAEPAAPGLLIRLPPPIEASTLVNVAAVRTLQLAAPDTAFLCGDQTMVTLTAQLLWRVTDPEKYAFGQMDPEATLAAVGRSALAEALARAPGERVLTDGRAEIEGAVMLRVGPQAAAVGAEAVAVALTQVAPPTQVLASYLEVVSAEEHKRRRVNEAEAYAAQVLPRARGDAAAIREAAYGRTSTVKAEAEADQAWLSAAARNPAVLDVYWRETIAGALAGRRLVLAPDEVTVWSGGSPVVPAKEK